MVTRPTCPPVGPVTSLATYAGGSVATADVAARTGHDRDALDTLLEAWLEATDLPDLPDLP